jgi:hypothetical protein
MVCRDSYSFVRAHRAMPRQGYLRTPAYLWVDLENGLRLPEGVVIPCIDDVADPVVDGPVGRPEDLCPDRRTEGEPEPPRPRLPVYMTRAAPLSHALGQRIFDHVDEHRGLTQA